MAESEAPASVGRRAPPLAPDFKAVALEHLEQRCDAFRQHVREHLERPGASAPLERLGDDLRRFRNTLVLLEYGGAVFVAEELLALLEARVAGEIGDEAVARVLVDAGERLGDHVARLRRGADESGGALALLPLVNDSRACRDAPPLSAALVLAAGIAPPAPSPEAAVTAVRAGREALAARLAAWRDAAQGAGASADTAPFEALATLAAEHETLGHLVPLFEAGAVLREARRDDELADGAALERLFGRLGRWLAGMTDVDASAADTAPSPPDALYRDVLYHVALLEPRTAVREALHRRFELERVRTALARAEGDGGGDALGARLATAIRESIDAETAALRRWLEQAPTAADHPHVLRLRERLAQLEPVLTLLDARTALSWLRRINATLERLAGGASVGAGERLALAESLIRLDDALDSAIDDPSRTETDGETARGETESGDAGAAAARRAVEEATAACLQEARRRLLAVGEGLDAPLRLGGSDEEALATIERALSLLPLSDLQPLLGGLRVAHRRVGSAAAEGLRETLATLIASLELYLGCVLHADEAGSRALLLDAEAALARLERRLGEGGADDARKGGAETEAGSSSAATATAASAASPEGRSAIPPAAERGMAPSPVDAPAPAAETVVEASAADGRRAVATEDAVDAAAALVADDESVAADGEPTEGAEPTRAALAEMESIGVALLGRGPDGVPATALRPGFAALAAVGARAGLDDLAALAAAAEGLLGRAEGARGGETPLAERELGLLEEAYAVLPQLIERAQGSSERARGLDALIGDLEESVVAASTSVPAAEPTPGPTSEPDGDDATLDAAGTLDDSSVLRFDSSLWEVFLSECETHVETLERTVEAALGGGSEAREPLPSDAMLRALHTLSGSAQTVDARDIVALVRPLQRAALARHRDALPFDEADTRYVGELVVALRARLTALESGQPVDARVHAIEARLPDFVARVSAFTGEGRPGSAAADAGEISLDSVFDEEARELLDAIRDDIDIRGGAEDDAGTSVDRALGRLHTLKGGARMAGRGALAERAHALEEAAQGAADTATARRLLSAGRRELQHLLLDTAPPTPAVPAHGILVDDATAAMPAATFDNLLTLATDVTVSQARLGEDIARVREVCRDLESAAGRWRRLPHDGPVLESPAVREMLADLEAARRGLGDALRLVDAEQQHASRAASSLQQTLIRTRLVRVDELRARLAQSVADAAAAVGREARLVVEGGEITLDGALARQLAAPLEHLVRNAVVHGIEAPTARASLGKEPTGTVRLSATLDGTELVIAVADDGAGIDHEAVSRRRAASGHAPVETTDALREVLCEAGFTTLDAASAVGGRGLGLAAVSETLARLEGRLHIGTRRGQGTTVSCRLRQRIIVQQAVLVRAARRLYALPVGVVRRVGADAEDEAPRRALIVLLGGAAPAPGREEGEGDDTDADGATELSVEAGGRPLVLEVDRVLGYRELLTQPLGPQLAMLGGYAGGSVLPDGRQVLVVELERLLGEGEGARGRGAKARPDPEAMRPVALVVDDSITLRVAAAGMLRRHGVESREARDGIEALESLARALPDLMIVDLDMPRLGGFDLIRRARERHGERAPPVIVVSSRDGEAERARAAELGAVRYLTKPYTETDLHEALLATGLRLPDLTIA